MNENQIKNIEIKKDGARTSNNSRASIGSLYE
jgi:hypothetical protein